MLIEASRLLIWNRLWRATLRLRASKLVKLKSRGKVVTFPSLKNSDRYLITCPKFLKTSFHLPASTSMSTPRSSLARCSSCLCATSPTLSRRCGLSNSRKSNHRCTGSTLQRTKAPQSYKATRRCHSRAWSSFNCPRCRGIAYQLFSEFPRWKLRRALRGCRTCRGRGRGTVRSWRSLATRSWSASTGRKIPTSSRPTSFQKTCPSRGPFFITTSTIAETFRIRPINFPHRRPPSKVKSHRAVASCSRSWALKGWKKKRQTLSTLRSATSGPELFKPKSNEPTKPLLVYLKYRVT